MTGTEVTTIIDILATKLGVTANEILPYYVKHYQLSGILLCLLGVILIIVPTVFTIWACKKEEINDTLCTVILTCLLGGILLGSSLIACNISNIVIPQKPAYQQLIADIRG